MVKRWFVPTQLTLYAFQGYQENKEELFWHRAHKMWHNDCFRYKDASMQFSLNAIESILDDMSLDAICLNNCMYKQIFRYLDIVDTLISFAYNGKHWHLSIVSSYMYLSINCSQFIMIYILCLIILPSSKSFVLVCNLILLQEIAFMQLIQQVKL